jgi:hypothetical protein
MCNPTNGLDKIMLKAYNLSNKQQATSPYSSLSRLNPAALVLRASFLRRARPVVDSLELAERRYGDSANGRAGAADFEIAPLSFDASDALSADACGARNGQYPTANSGADTAPVICVGVTRACAGRIEKIDPGTRITSAGHTKIDARVDETGVRN